MLAVALLPLLAGIGCAARSSSPALPTQREWDAARAWLLSLRSAEPTRPYGAVVRVSMREPHTRREWSARGAVAVDPHRALRMILVGPGGVTALDVWATKERWRFEVPPANLLRRGGREDDRVVPIGFFRWWFLSPVEGRLLTSVALGDAERLILRSGTATVDFTDVRTQRGYGPPHAVTASRLADGSLDTVDFHGAPLGLAPGDRTVYDAQPSGAHVEVTVESASDPPDPAAFTDPDAPSTPVAELARP